MILPPDEEVTMSAVRDHHRHGAQAIFDEADDGHRPGAHEDRLPASRRFRRVEVVTGEPRRRRWSREEKARIVALSWEPGCNISALARDHGVGIGLLHDWRRVARERTSEGAMTFVPLAVGASAAADALSSCRLADEAPVSIEGSIALELHGVRILIGGRVDRAALATILMAVRASA
jgi:transposase